MKGDDPDNPFAAKPKSNPFVLDDDEEAAIAVPTTPPRGSRGEAVLRAAGEASPSTPGSVPKLPPPKPAASSAAPGVAWSGTVAGTNPFAASSAVATQSSGGGAANANAILSGREREINRREEAVRNRRQQIPTFSCDSRSCALSPPPTLHQAALS